MVARVVNEVNVGKLEVFGAPEADGLVVVLVTPELRWEMSKERLSQLFESLFAEMVVNCLGKRRVENLDKNKDSSLPNLEIDVGVVVVNEADELFAVIFLECISREVLGDEPW